MVTGGEVPISTIVHNCRNALSQIEHPDPRIVVLWGSILDALEGVIAYDNKRDIDVLVVCDNAEKIKNVKGRNFSGMPSTVISVAGYRYDIFLADVSYIAQALRNQRWTVTRAISHGFVIFDDGALRYLRDLCHEIEPFTLAGWEDWLIQARSLIPKITRHVADGQFGYAELLIRDSLNMFCSALVYRKEGSPVTPTTFPGLFESHFGSTDLFYTFHEIHGIHGITKENVQRHYLLLNDIIFAEE